MNAYMHCMHAHACYPRMYTRKNTSVLVLVIHLKLWQFHAISSLYCHGDSHRQGASAGGGGDRMSKFGGTGLGSKSGKVSSQDTSLLAW